MVVKLWLRILDLMRESSEIDQGQKKSTEIKTFSVPFSEEEIKNSISISTFIDKQLPKEKIINQAFNFHSKGNIQEAIKYYQYFLNKGYEDHRVFSNYGVILKNLGKSKEAEFLQRKAIEINPNFAAAHSNLGIILKDLGNLKEAELSQRKAIELRPDFAEAYSNLGNILRDLGLLKEAESSYRKAIELKPDSAENYYNLGTILKDLRKLDDSINCYEKAIELKKDFQEALAEMGRSMTLKGNYEEGLKKIKEGYGSIIFDHTTPAIRIDF